ncbi:hypothetical protein ACFC8N_04600 [Streptomyces sp. NPDC055966]|uniref:hypothetical protein n=1 Tax=unclassified Streptomyces TaxID=2593676 RepID=UPI0035DF45A5
MDALFAIDGEEWAVDHCLLPRPPLLTPAVNTADKALKDKLAALARAHGRPISVAARLCSPVLACTLLHGVVPDLTTVTWADGGPAVRLAHLSGRPVADLPSTVGAVYAQLTGPLAAVERALPAKVAPRPLDGNLASALVGSAGVLLRARPGLRAPLTELTTALLDTGRLRGTGRISRLDGHNPVRASPRWSHFRRCDR